MTYTIKFVNFTLAAPFQKKSSPLMGGGCACSPRSMGYAMQLEVQVIFSAHAFL